MFPFLLISTSLPVDMHIFQWIYRVSPQIEAKQRCGEGAGEAGGEGMFCMSPMVQKGEGLKYIALKHLVFI